MRDAPEIIATGGIIIDNIVTPDGTVHRATLGGNAVYAAAGARLWSKSTALVGVVPADYPVIWLQRIAAAGIDVSGVLKSTETGLASEWFFHREDGGRVDHLHADAGAYEAFGLRGDRIDPAQARAFEAHLGRTQPAGETFKAFRARHPVMPETIPDSFSAAKGLHCAPNQAAAQRRLIESAHRHGSAVTLDPGFAAGDLAPMLSELLPYLDAFLPSEKELAVLQPDRTPQDAARALVGAGAKLVVAKLGPKGALVASGEDNVEIPVVPVAAIDPTGAGDAFCGGFLAGWLRTRDPIAAACCGAVSASFAIEDFGCLKLLATRRQEAVERLVRLAHDVPRLSRHHLALLAAPPETAHHD